MSDHFADRLLEAVRDKNNPVCVGLDPVYDRLPPAVRELPEFNDGQDAESALDAILEFSRIVIRTIAPLVPAIKINTAYFERYYGEGVDAYLELVQEAVQAGLVVIGDCKRSDVGHSAELLAGAQLADPEFINMEAHIAPHAVTLNPYIGLDGLRPFLNVCQAAHKGVFVLVRTSNEDAETVQGFSNAEGLTLSEHIAGLVDTWGSTPDLMGTLGYSCVGAVVAPRNAELAVRLRQIMPRSLFLVPGFGAQGINAEQLVPCFKSDGTGALVNSSRQIIYAFDDPRYQSQSEVSWIGAVEQACRDFAREVAQTIDMR